MRQSIIFIINLKTKKMIMNTIKYNEPRKDVKLLPWQVTGLTDGEGGFNCYIAKKETEKLISNSFNTNIKLEFKVTQKSHSAGILYELKEFFGCGSVVIDNRKTDTKKYHVTSLYSILENIIPHYEKYPCLTSKNLNFKDWKKIALILSQDTTDLNLKRINLENILNLSSQMNKNRLFEDKYNYCNSSLGLMQNNSNGEKCASTTFNLPAHWVQTFLTGESVFYTYFSYKKSRGKIYQGCDSSLELGQNNHDIAVLISLQKFFEGGYIKPKYNYTDIHECKKSRSVNRFILRNTDKIIEFVDNYPMLTRKQLDYLDWKKVIELKKVGKHKTEEGSKLIKKILSNINSRR